MSQLREACSIRLLPQTPDSYMIPDSDTFSLLWFACTKVCLVKISFRNKLALETMFKNINI